MTFRNMFNSFNKCYLNNQKARELRYIDCKERFIRDINRVRSKEEEIKKMCIKYGMENANLILCLKLNQEHTYDKENDRKKVKDFVENIIKEENGDFFVLDDEVVIEKILQGIYLSEFSEVKDTKMYAKSKKQSFFLITLVISIILLNIYLDIFPSDNQWISFIVKWLMLVPLNVAVPGARGYKFITGNKFYRQVIRFSVIVYAMIIIFSK